MPSQFHLVLKRVMRNCQVYPRAYTDLGVVCVVAARNNGLNQTSMMFPASIKNVLSAGSCSPTDQSSHHC